mgnify:CR=1 FL=1
MNLYDVAIRRPVFTVMVTLVVIILGVVSLVRLPVDLMPEITYPRISISTSYEGAGPEEIETLVTRPIEEAMSAVPGVEEVTSSLLPQVCHLQDKCQSDQSVKFQYGTTFVVPYKS